ncbi:PD-(D/E)XK nuclease family protein [Mesorhizobium sp. M0954]|uniref:PD-(D/E)XK nuclease family protein n=1 Tax=Mesorhizobium sp. M0954 TaxID=2957032 RepID=UPI0033386064
MSGLVQLKVNEDLLRRRLVIVDTLLAMRMARLEAAKAGQHGVEILTLSLLAARLAGGFVRPADRANIYGAVNVGLVGAELIELHSVRRLPGMARAVVRSLAAAWREAMPLADLARSSDRAADLHRLDRDVRANLPSGMLAPPDLAAVAIANADLSVKLFDSVVLKRLLDVDPVWRPLLAAITGRLPVSWLAIGTTDRSWFQGGPLEIASGSGVISAAEICADPRSEAIEALRWVRSLLSSGHVQASDIALVAASPSAWDEHLQVFSAGTVNIHFCHGRPALGTAPGQACAALADVLLHGLSQDRVRRLQRLSPYLRKELPLRLLRGLKPDAGLFSVAQWRRALEALGDESSMRAMEVLGPILDLLEGGVGKAAEAGERLLAFKSRALWRDALRQAPAAALTMTLKTLRVADDFEPGNSVVWGPAAELASAPRKYMRLMGVSARSWPRADADDPILPARTAPLRPDRQSVTSLDRQHFSILVSAASGACVISRSSRSAEGTLLSPSPLWPAKTPEAIHLPRTRIPAHAANEADRLLARSAEARSDLRIAAAQLAWTNWNRREVTAHDGRLRLHHPVVARTFSRPHSSTSLRRLLRDPLAFIWKYGLELYRPRWATRPLELEPAVVGELVHEMIKETIGRLQPVPGLTRASDEQLRDAIRDAARFLQDQWPLTRPVPPPTLWRYTLEDAVRRTKRALTPNPSDEEGSGLGTHTWSELAFGDNVPAQDAPWKGIAAVGLAIRDYRIKLEGRIDRLDLSADQRMVILSDYKTGAVPSSVRSVVLDGGREIQRTLYAMVVRQLLGNDMGVVSRLVYLDRDVTTAALSGDRLARAEAELTARVATAALILEAGEAPPGPDAVESYNELRLLLPADLDRYLARKHEGFERAASGLLPLWAGP